MGSRYYLRVFIFWLIIGFSSFIQCMSTLLDTNAILLVNVSQGSARKMPDNLFGVSFEEINHAGAGGLWGELVSNRGFESGGRHTPAHIDPWSVIGDYSLVRVVTDLSSCFKTNPVALRMEVVCDTDGVNACPRGGVGIYNPGYWGMNIEKGKTYKLIMYIRSIDSVDVAVSLSDSTGMQTLATTNIIATDVSNWQKMEFVLKANATNHNSRLQFKTNKKVVIWFDQVSLMPMDTYKGHGFRNDLFRMVANLKPGFIRFPGGDFAQGKSLINGYWWKDTIGPWEQRPGHLNDVWQYWTDDGLGYFEFLQLAEDLGASPIWVFNSGFSQNEGVNPSNISPLVQDALDGIEFARGDPNSTWGSVRAAMGHTQPFNLKHVAIGNQNCGRPSYRDNYLKFYTAIRKMYPDIKLISNCDGSNSQLDHPADLYDYHVYVNANTMFSMARTFDRTSRIGPKAFVSEYAVTGNGGLGNLLAALAEAGFLFGIEKNSDVVDMASNAPLFLNANTPSDKGFRPDAIVFDSYRLYGTPSYWMQQFFSMSNGATLLDSTLQMNTSSSLIASAIWFQNQVDNNKNYLRVKVVNYGSNQVNLRISFDGLNPGSIDYARSSKVVLSSTNVIDENSFKTPTKVSPVKSLLKKIKNDMNVILPPYSLTSFDLLIVSKNIAHLNAINDNFCVSSTK